MTLSCTDFQDDLSALLDGELDQHRQTAIAEHISSCSPCLVSHDSFKGVGKLLQGANARVQETTPDIWASISSRLPSVCECIQDDLSAYLDGELIAPAAEGVAQHLEACSTCLSQFNKLSEVNSLLSKGLVLPESFEVDIWSQVKARLNDDCVLIRSELSAFIDREVATLRHRTITQHLTECEDCKLEFTALSQTGDALRACYQPDIPEDLDLWSKLQGQLNVVPFEARERPRAVRPVRRLYAAAALAFAGIAASLMVFMYTQSQSSTPVSPVTAEAYLIDQSLGEPTDVAEAVVYDHQP